MTRKPRAGFLLFFLLLLFTAWLGGLYLRSSQAQNDVRVATIGNQQPSQNLARQFENLRSELDQVRAENERLRSHVNQVVQKLQNGSRQAPRQALLAKTSSLPSSLPGPRLGPMTLPRLPHSVTFAGQTIPLNQWDVRERVEREFYWLLGDPAYVILLLKRMGRFFPYFQDQLRKGNMPDDLKYLAIIESSLNTSAFSYAGASGLWQFIKSTGRRYGMKYNAWIDERRNVEKSTNAAIRYLGDLHKRFGDWPLAMAAYNAGEMRVSRAMIDQDIDTYYQLRLPNETERYVFKIIAAKVILGQPARYGFALMSTDYYKPHDTALVQIHVREKRVRLTKLAKAAGTYYRHFKQLNPSIRRDILPRGKHWIRVPRVYAQQFVRNVNVKPKKKITRPKVARRRRIKTQGRKVVYEVKRGDTLWGIADKHSVSVSRLRRWNGLTRGKPIFPGDDIVVFTK